jgi:hypothetical protein
MKLKLETQDPAQPNITTLVVSETIEPANIAVLKAGLSKLFQSGKKNILLDFTPVLPGQISAPSLHKEISDLRGWAVSSDAQLLVVSPIETVGHAKPREEALKLMSSSEGPLLDLEAKLQSDLKAAEQKKTELEQKLTQANAAGDPKLLMKENSDLKRSIAEAERLTYKFLKLRTQDPYALPSFQLAREALEEILTTVLKKEGVLE